MKALYFTLIFVFLSCKGREDSKHILITTPVPILANFAGDEFTLKEYILNYSLDKYQVQHSFFEQATIENTDFLRAIVHYQNYRNKAEARRPEKERYNEVGYMFKDQGVGENCGFMSTTLYDIYKSFGYKVKRYDVIDGSLKGSFKYRDSHVFVEVYIPSLKKYIIQDPTINNSIFSCKNRARLSFGEFRESLYIDNVQPCFLENKISTHISPNENLSLRQRSGVLEDYYTGTVLSLKKFDANKEFQIKLLDMGTVANENRRVADLKDLKALCKDCGFAKNIFEKNVAMQSFMKCLNTKILVQGILTASFDRKEKGLLLQYTNEKGKNVIYDPSSNFYLGKSYFSYAYWDLNNRGYLLKRDFRHMTPLKFYSYRTNEVFEF